MSLSHVVQVRLRVQVGRMKLDSALKQPQSQRCGIDPEAVCMLVFGVVVIRYIQEFCI